MEKSILVSIIAVFTILALTCVVNANTGDLTDTDNWEVTINGVEYNTGDLIGIEAGETFPIKVVFKAVENASDVRVKVWIDGYRNEISDKTERFELVDGSIYTKYFSLTLPEDVDPTEEYTLIIRISDKTKSDEEEYSLKLQRESYNLEILSAETEGEVTPGSVIAVNVVLKNRGMKKLEDIFVKARIPELNIEKKIYFGDLDPLDECEYDDDCEGNRKDSGERTIYLTLPENAKTGVYSLEVEAYNMDSSDLVKKNIAISGVEKVSGVLSSISSRDLNIGEEVTYDLILINSGDKMEVYTLTPEETPKGLIVEVEPIVTVPADSSKTIKVKVKATESAEEGTHIITINVESKNELIKQVNFSANVEKGKAQDSIVILTVILAIVFVVLLIILIVLLKKKPTAEETEEETSYY